MYIRAHRTYDDEEKIMPREFNPVCDVSRCRPARRLFNVLFVPSIRFGPYRPKMLDFKIFYS